MIPWELVAVILAAILFIASRIRKRNQEERADDARMDALYEDWTAAVKEDTSEN